MTTSEALRILIVDDSPTDAKLVAQELQRGGRAVTWERVETRDAMRASLAQQRWDAVICDWSMPRFTAAKALATMKEAGLDVPFIIVSGTIGEETAVEAMRAGAHDYVLKDRLGRLNPVLERELREAGERAGRRHSEAALARSETRFRRLAESGVIGIAIGDVQGEVLDANDAYLDLIGFSRDDLGRGEVHWAKLTPPEFAEATARALEQLKTTGAARPWETETLRKDGRRVPVLVGAAMLEPPESIAFVADLTDRRRAEEARARAEEALQRSESQLRQAQKMEAVGRLAGGVAHDFNNVLSVILSYAELILRELGDTDPLREDMEEIAKAAERAAGLTHQLLMFSRQQVIAPRVIDLHERLNGLKRMLQRVLGEDVELVVAPPKRPGRVNVDPSHFDQVVMNLVVNARDAMPRGGKLTIETENVALDEEYTKHHLPAKAGEYVMMAVSDTGIGMTRETMARIFEPFFTTKEIGKGTGLGLSTVFGIVAQSGGHIWVYSEVGTGTSFKVYLPRVDKAVDVATAQATPASLRGTETILVVEDEDQVRAIVVNILRRQGYHVIPAENAGEALLLCDKRGEAIDLLLTDVVMPHMSGPELAARLKANRPRLRVLCMSGYTDDSIVRHGVLESGVAFVQKPVTPHVLATKVREVLDANPG
jgi:two-component system cell cycle sensor histidine kinase/response regulator CckA